MTRPCHELVRGCAVLSQPCAACIPQPVVGSSVFVYHPGFTARIAKPVACRLLRSAFSVDGGKPCHMVLVLDAQAFRQIVQRLSIGKRWRGAVNGCQHVRIGFLLPECHPAVAFDPVGAAAHRVT